MSGRRRQGRPLDAALRRLRGVDLALFRRLADTRIPVLGRALPLVSRSANRSRVWLVVASLLAVTGKRSGRRAALRGVLAVSITSVVTNLAVKLLTGRKRPDLGPVPRVRHLARPPRSTSFPSGHAASAFAFAAAAGMEMPRLRLPLYGAASTVALSRVYTGVHYPGDVLAGAALGTAIAYATTRTWPLTDPRPATAARTPEVGVLADPDGAGIVIVANTGAGNALGAEAEAKLREVLPAMEVIAAGDGEELPALLERAAERAKVLGVAGGDGSASAAAAVAHAARLPLLVIPAGTLNHLAKDLGVEDLEATVAAVQERRAIVMDLGEIDGRTFVNAASVGAYPHLVAGREQLEGRIGKWPAAFLSLLQILWRGSPTEVDVDGEPRRLWLLSFGNGEFRAEGLAPHRRSHLDDGLLDVRLLHAEVPWARTRVLLSVLAGRLGRCAAYERWTAEEVRVISRQGPLRLAQDGETWVGSERFTVRKLPRSLVVMQPHPGQASRR